MQFTKEDVIKLVEQNNALINAFAAHSQFNKDNPGASPRPLFFAADFVRRTMTEFLLPLLPPNAQNKSFKVANRAIFPYSPRVPGDHPPFPEPVEGQGDWLESADAEWPGLDTAEAKGMYGDALSRTRMVAMAIGDERMGAMILGGRFDWASATEVQNVLREIKGSG